MVLAAMAATSGNSLCYIVSNSDFDCSKQRFDTEDLQSEQM